MEPDAGLSAAQLLDVIDAADGGDAALRGRVLARAACPELSAEQLDGLSLGQRDAQILALRCATFGDTLPARVTCRHCGLRLSVKVPREHLTPEPPGGAGPVRLEEGAVVVEARMPDGAVLARAAACPDAASARRALIAGCVVSATDDGQPVDPLALGAGLLERLGEALVAADPQAEVRVPVQCAGCAAEWSPVFDVTHFLWNELTATSVQLLDEVHQLAVAYGWSEEQILRLPSRRRRRYVERLADD